MTSPIHNKSGELLEHTYHPGSRTDILVILGHGVTGNMDRPVVKNTAEALASAGYPCLRFSFSGNGGSEGRFEDSTISKEVQDLTAVIDQVQGPQKIIYVGHSQGGAVGTLFAARDERLSALITLAGMVNTRGFYDREFSDQTPGSGFMWDEPDCPLSPAHRDDLYSLDSTLDAARAVRTPWLLLHGSDDDVVLPEDSLSAFEAAKCKKKHRLIPGLSHSFAEDPSAAPAEILTFLETVV